MEEKKHLFLGKDMIRGLLNCGGFAIGVAGVWYVINRFVGYSGQVDFSNMTMTSWLFIILLLLAYSVANILLALAWRDMMTHFGQDLNAKWAVRTYGLAQIGKYIPGNIFQFAGRQVIGQAAGLPASPLAKTILWELGLLASSGVLFSVLVIPVFFPEISTLAATAAFVLVLAGTITGSRYLLGRHLTEAIIKEIGYLAINGIVFFGVLWIVAGSGNGLSDNIVEIIGVYVLAWLAGLITPGAPAGIGVREVIFLTLLRGVVRENDLLEAIILGRVVSIGGDVLFYILSLVMKSLTRDLVIYKKQ